MVAFTLWSDLHLHHGHDDLHAETDIVVIAGDTGEGLIGMNLLKRLCIEENKKVVYILGNHDCYSLHEFSGMDIDEIIQYWKSAKDALGDNFHFLNNDVCVIDGQRFVGTTLWSRIPPDASMIASNDISDFKKILVNGKPITVEEYNRRHEESVSFLFENIREGDVVVLHHAPSNYGADTRYKIDPLSYCYYTDISNMLLDANPSCVVYGHMHNGARYFMSDILVASNPRGYLSVGMGNDSFQENYVIEAGVKENILCQNQTFSIKR